MQWFNWKWNDLFETKINWIIQTIFRFVPFLNVWIEILEAHLSKDCIWYQYTTNYAQKSSEENVVKTVKLCLPKVTAVVVGMFICIVCFFLHVLWIYVRWYKAIYCPRVHDKPPRVHKKEIMPIFVISRIIAII